MFIPAKEPMPNLADTRTGNVLGWHGLAQYGYVHTVSYN